ncbi:hypothetical protein BDW02DRAFT_601183 [Decorospora gaudefroyi]|uniref:Uncharacterized protein n=1 Tax=Decorospora gaudefroyi TaxID=184978 RepID=A0A6A5K960_9PLEO|nr:hypothetical protein BDW02DRAFT_601183 [Decorospora gaudefroyi]
MAFHNVGEVSLQKRQEKKRAGVPPQANLIAAASYVRQFFESKRFTYAIMGGFEMLCIGHCREMSDLHIAYDDKDFSRIKAKLAKDKRMHLPDGLNDLFPSKILVQTGPPHHDIGCTASAMIEVNLVPTGSFGTPPNGTLNSNIVLLSLKTNGVLKTYKGLNMLYLIKTLVHFCTVRDLAWDPCNDIVFLCQRYGKQIESVRSQLDQNAIQHNFLVTAFLTRLPFADQRICYQALLGHEPPPIMAVTPPSSFDSHVRSQSAFEFPRPRIATYNSAPGTRLQTSAEFINPSRSENDLPTRNRVASTMSQLIEGPISPLESSELIAPSRELRSRYRPVSALYNKRNNPERPRPVGTSYTQSNVVHQIPQQGPKQLHHTQRYRTQNLAVDTGCFNPAASTPQTNYHTLTSNPGKLWLPPSNTTNIAKPSFSAQRPLTVEISAASAPRQQPIKPGVANIPIIKNPIPPPTRNVQQVPKTDDTGTPKSLQQVTSLHLVGSEGELLPPLQHPPKAHEDMGASRLHLVGPEGVHQTPPPPSSSRVRSSTTTIPKASRQPPVFELDAQEPSIVSKLSANIDAALHDHAPSPKDWYNDSSFLDTPVDEPAQQNTSPNARPHIPLPPSLMVGTTHRFSTSPQTSAALVHTTYQHHHRRQTIQPPLAPAPLTVYKAYHPHTTTTTTPLDISPPPPDSASSEYAVRVTSFGKVKDIDGAHGYFRTHHKRHDSHVAGDACQLAMEYQAELPDWGCGYGVVGRD